MPTGWIKLHRKLLDWGWYYDANVLRVFIHLLLIASHTRKQWGKLTINPGDVKIKQRDLAKELKITHQQLRSTLEKLQSTHEITIKTTNKYTVISVNNWSDYQQNNTQNNTQTTNKQHTSNTLTPYVKNVKNDKNNTNDLKVNKKFMEKIRKDLNNKFVMR
jgi:hypothetical protein